MSRSLKIAFTFIGSAFLLLFLAIGITLRLAYQNFEPITDSDYYRKGLEYQSRLDSVDRAKTNGWLLDSNFFHSNNIKAGKFQTEFVLSNSQNKALESGKIRVLLERPATSSAKRIYDMDVSLSQKATGGDYVVPLEILIPESGSWDVSVEMVIDNDMLIMKQKRIFAL